MDWSKGILTEQDLEFLDILNQITDILTMEGRNPEVQDRIMSINNYLQKYCVPDGFKERMEKWNKED